jgi:hypothetical protein
MCRHRIEYDGAVYHVIQRSSNREMIFGKVRNRATLCIKFSSY